MYKICFKNDSIVQPQGQPCFNSVSELMNTALAAQTMMLEASDKINALRVLLQNNNKVSIAQFDKLRDSCIAQIKNACHCGHTVFDGHVNIDVVFSGGVEESVSVRIPDLIGLLTTFYSNFSELSRCDDETLAERMRNSEKAHSSPEATIQGVRLNTFMPRTVQSCRLQAINSLTSLTGLHAMSYGNTLVSSQMCRQTQIPLQKACIHINNIAIEYSNGSVSNLISQINVATDRHGVRAVGGIDKPLTLIAYSGRKIEVKIASQAGALLSGFSPGVTEVAAQSRGLVVWVSFLPLSAVKFDSSRTATHIMGQNEKTIMLKPKALKDLSINMPLERQLACYLLQVVQRIVLQEREYLVRSLTRLTEIKSTCPEDHKQVFRAS